MFLPGGFVHFVKAISLKKNSYFLLTVLVFTNYQFKQTIGSGGNKMKKFKIKNLLVFAIMLALVSTSSAAFAGVLIEKVDFNVGTDVYSKYIWRGQNLTDNWVIQPAASATYKWFTGGILASYDSDEGEWTELDFTIDATTDLGFINESLEKLSASLGYTYYTFPNIERDLDISDSHELYLSLGLDVLLSPYFTVYYDWDTGDGTYFEGGISHTFALEYFDITPSASIGYNAEQWEYESSFSAALLSVNVSKTLGKYFTVGATIAESIALDDQYDSEFYGGVNLSASF